MVKKVSDIRSAFIDFFKDNGHNHVESSPLVPHNDPSLMFTNSGMVQFKDYFTGLSTPKFTRATTSQKCVRAGGKHNDLENVGYTARHHTFFEMLGNFSFGDYFKKDAIHYAYNFLTKIVGINKDKLYFTVYHTDDEAFNYWKAEGVDESRIIKIDTSDNFWSMGDVGPCGPCSEIFYDHGEGLSGGLPGQPDEGGARYVEIWNLVFMQYEQKAGGNMVPLPKPSIDTGMGLERFAAVMQSVHDNYDIDLFFNLINSIEEVAKVSKNTENAASFKVIADHLRSISFLIADGVMPSNEGRGYVLRRILRRAMRHVHHLGSKDPIMHKLLDSLIREMGGSYPELIRARDFIYETIKLEEVKFQETLERGIKILDQELDSVSEGGMIPGNIAFKLYDTFGFPLDLTVDIARRANKNVDIDGFDAEMHKQKEAARKSWIGSGEQSTNELWFDLKNTNGSTEFLGYKLNEADASIVGIVVDGKSVEEINAEIGTKFQFITNQTPFYGESGGQMGDSGIVRKLGSSEFEIYVHDTKKILDLHVHFAEVKKSNGSLKIADSVRLSIDVEKRNRLRANHSATHLLHAALRKVLGNHVTQKGSMVSDERFRFDFSHNKPVTKDEIRQIEEIINAKVLANSSIDTKIMDIKSAIDHGAMALFGEKYSDEVRVVSMGVGCEDKHYSVELCGGTHAKYTGDIGLIKIVLEESIASGVRRIEAISGIDALKYVQKNEEIMYQIGDILKSTREDYVSRINNIIANNKAIAKDVSNLKRKMLDLEANNFEQIGDINLLAIKTSGIDFKDAKSWIDNVTKVGNNRLVIMALDNDGKSTIVTSCSNPENLGIDSVKIAEYIVKSLGGSGCGGKSNFAQGGCPSSDNFYNVIKQIKDKFLLTKD